jgi:hypothetical protein
MESQSRGKGRADFLAASRALTSLYKECELAESSGLMEGRKQAYEDILNWVLTTHSGDLKHISVTSFLHFIQERLHKCSPVPSEELISTSPPSFPFDQSFNTFNKVNLAGFRFSDSRKRTFPKNCLSDESMEFRMSETEPSSSSPRKIYAVKRNKKR